MATLNRACNIHVTLISEMIIVNLKRDHIAATMVHGQFDDAVQGNPNVRQGNAYIDTYDPGQETLTWSDTPEDDSGDDDELYDETCVDDEDWENAERGAF